jgi:hypothetical protein
MNKIETKGKQVTITAPEHSTVLIFNAVDEFEVDTLRHMEQAVGFKCAIAELDNKLRSVVKYGTKGTGLTRKQAEKFRELLYKVLGERGYDVHDIM